MDLTICSIAMGLPCFHGFHGFSTSSADGCEILHQLIDGKHPIIYRVSIIQGGAGFLPSTSM